MEKKTSHRSVGNGYLLTFSDHEEITLLEFLEINKFEGNKEGLKEFILCAIYAEYEEKKIKDTKSKNIELVLETIIKNRGTIVKTALNAFKLFKRNA